MNKLLERQLKKHFGDLSNIPEDLQNLLRNISDTYDHYDESRNLLERSLDVSSQELYKINSEMKAVFESFPDIFFRIDYDGKILDYNVGNLSFLFSRSKKLLGKYIQKIPFYDVDNKFESAINQVTTLKTKINFEYSLLQNDKQLYYEANLFPILENQIIVFIRDITDRKQYEENLADNEKRLKAIFEGSNDAIILLNDDIIFDCNSRTLEIFSYSNKNEIIGKSLADLSPENQPENKKSSKIIKEYCKKVFSKGRLHFEWILKNKYNVELPTEISLSSFDYANKKIIHATIRDISERHLTHIALLESEERFRNMANSIQDGLSIIENEKVIYYNDKACEIFETSREDFEKLNIIDIIVPEDKLRIEKIMFESKTIGNQPKELVFWINCKKSHKKCIYNRYTYYEKENNIFGRYIVTTDITEIKLTEEELSRSNKLFRSYFDLPLIGIAISSSDKKLIEVNDKLCRILGYTKEEILKLSWDDLNPIDDMEFKEENLFKQVISGILNGVGIEKRYIRKDKKIINVFICTSLVKKEDGSVDFFFSIIDDITYRKQIEEKVEQLMLELKKVNQELEHRVQSELKKNRDKDLMLIQQSRQAAMGEMIGNIAHQWRQPLSAISIIIQNLQDAYNFGELNEEYVDTRVNRAMEIISYMSETIDDFRNFFKSNKESQLFNLVQPVNKAISFLDASLKNNNISLFIDKLEDVYIQGYPNEYAQVILNIVNNAKDVLLERKIAYPEIHINLTLKNNKSNLSIKDNAGGIPEEVIDKVFEPYFTTKEQGSGTGLGLYMSKTIIEKNMKGSLFVRNSLDGAEFIIIV